ncbi:MAG TPA: DNRLRE domain-containing protein, partial [Candidatus Sulfotelmatobacter sp.]
MKTSRSRLQAAMLVLVILGSWTIAYAQITPSADAYTNTATPTLNLGTKPLLDVESASQTAYIQFDLSSVPSGYTSANVAKATLKLYVNAVTAAGSFNVDFVNGTWSEKTITADLAPALGTTIASSVPLTTANVHDYVLIDVTSAVGAWLDGTDPNDGIALVANSPLNASFDSKENTTNSQPPELDIVFAGSGAGTITGVTTATGSGLTGGGTSGTLNLGLTKTCAANQVLQWNGTGWVCSSAGSGTVTSVASGPGLTGGPITSGG